MIRRRSPRGVTLLELILVMGILVVFAAVLAPRFSDFFPSLQVDRTARTVLAWARKARADAALTGAHQRLVFDFEKRMYWIEYQREPLRKPDTFTRRIGAWKEESYPEAVTLEPLEGLEPVDGKIFLEFLPDGTTQDVSILVRNQQGDEHAILVTGATSRIEIVTELEEP